MPRARHSEMKRLPVSSVALSARILRTRCDPSGSEKPSVWKAFRRLTMSIVASVTAFAPRARVERQSNNGAMFLARATRLSPVTFRRSSGLSQGSAGLQGRHVRHVLPKALGELPCGHAVDRQRRDTVGISCPS